MKNIEQINLGNNENISVKKGYFGYRIVQPIKNQDGTTNWINLLIGGWGNFLTLLFIMFVILSFLYGVREMTTGCREMAAHPCNYFDIDCSRETYGGIYTQEVNYEKEKIGGT